MSTQYQLYTDGGCDPNPGHCAAGAIIVDESETVMYMLSEYIGMGTNNLGELTAIFMDFSGQLLLILSI